MFRIGILGSENSHAMAFSKIFNGFQPEFGDEFADFRVVGTFGTDAASNEALVKEADVSFIADKPEDLLGRVDAVMVTARDGQFHASYVRPFIEAGLPAFVDKPFTRDSAEALALVRRAKEKKTPLCGGSSLKCCPDTKTFAAYVAQNRDKLMSGDIYAPVNMKNEYGDFWFYSSHLTEIVLSVFGYNPEWIFAHETKNGVSAMTHYDDFNVMNHFSEGMYQYAGTAVTRDGIHTQNIDLGTAYAEECRIFARMVRTGAMTETYEELIQPVYYIEALLKSVETGICQKIIKAEL